MKWVVGVIAFLIILGFVGVGRFCANQKKQEERLIVNLIIDANDRFCALCSYQDEDAKYKVSFLELCIEDDCDFALEMMKRIEDFPPGTEIPNWQFVQIIEDNGIDKWVEILEKGQGGEKYFNALIQPYGSSFKFSRIEFGDGFTKVAGKGW